MGTMSQLVNQAVSCNVQIRPRTTQETPIPQNNPPCLQANLKFVPKNFLIEVV